MAKASPRHMRPAGAAAWLKVKLARTLDLVVLAAEWGSGRRKGWLSNLHLGARDPASGEFVMLGKTFKGMTDEMLAWQTQQLLALETAREAHGVRAAGAGRRDRVQRHPASPHYPGGLALRFARVKGYRPDKARRGRHHRHGARAARLNAPIAHNQGLCSSQRNCTPGRRHHRAARPTAHDVQIEILFCGVCHSDLHQARNEWHDFMPTLYPCVPGPRDRRPRDRGRRRR